MDMKLCEVCGTVEEMEKSEIEVKQFQLLHVCESCQNDRKLHSFDPED
jgi:ribosome-binding protein aMBF1 (putative translation factor)